MHLNSLFSQEVVVWVVFPALIFFAGVIYVSLGTLRIIFVARRSRFLSPLLGFFEVVIWLIAISQLIGSVTNIAAYFAYAAGFAVGNYAGILIEEKIAIGIAVVRIIVTAKDDILLSKLSAAGYGVTRVGGKGSKGDVNLFFTIVRRKDLEDVTRIIDESHENAFYSIEDARCVTEGIFPKSARFS